MSPQGPWGTIYGLPTPPSTPGSVVEIGEKVKAKVEHPFLKVKWQFGYAKVRYRGLSTNLERLAMLLGWPICWRREGDWRLNPGDSRPKIG